MSGRRTRAAAAKSNIAFKTAITDQNFASPKRKDCKLDIDSVPLMTNGRSPKSPASIHNVNGVKRNHKNATGTKSKKPSQAITKFFHVNGHGHSAVENTQRSIDSVDENCSASPSHQPTTNAEKQNESKDAVNSQKSKSEIHKNGSILLSPEAMLMSPEAKSLLNGSIKQTTPHRIVCHSSPSKKLRLYAKDPIEVFSHLHIRDGSSPKAKPGNRTNRKNQQKSRRKLNVNEVENSENGIVPVVNLDDDDDVVPLMNVDNKKPVLNGTIDQNATNNNKEFVRPKNAAPRRVQNDSQMTDYFPIRRSGRKTKQVVEQEQSRSIEIAIQKQLEDGLVVKVFPEKGRGIVAGREFQRGEFVVEYIGELIDQTEADRREEEYAKNAEFGCYMYYFKHKNQQWCIDATAETGKLGRLVNHSRNGNLATKIVNYENKPHLVLIAKDDIKEGEELTYDYGDRRKEALIHHPWLAF